MMTDPKTDSLQEQLNGFLAHVHRETRVPGIGAAISVQGRRIHSSVGVLAKDEEEPLTKDSEFHLGCITKLFVSVVVLELVWEKVLDLTASLGEYLPELRNTAHGKSVTLAHLLSHTSGYRGLNIFEHNVLAMDWSALIDYLHAAPQDFLPGTVFNYEHSEAVLAGEIVRRATGKSVIAHIDQRIFEAAGISVGIVEPRRRTSKLQVGQHLADPKVQYKQVFLGDLIGDSSTALSSIWESSFSKYSVSLDGLLAITEYLMGQSTRLGVDGPAMSASTLSLLQRPAVCLPTMISGPLPELMPITYGLGAAHWRDGFYGIGGATYGQCQGFRFDPRLGAGVVVGVNALQPHLRDIVIGRICESLGNFERDERSAPITEFELHDLVGEYQGPGTNRVFASLDAERLDILIETGTTTAKVHAEIVYEPGEGLILSATAPFLSIGFFREHDNGDVGLMIGMNAYKRVKGGENNGDSCL
jgi:CubicO group peptidase (beta-lactamase class C family)